MSWIRFDDRFVDDPAIYALGDDEAIAGWTYLRAVSYAAQHLTDGVLPAGFLRRESPGGIAALARVGLLELRADGSGYLPRFLEVRDASGRIAGGHHPSRRDVEARRQARVDAGRTGGLESGRSRRAEANGEASRQATTEATRKQSASHSPQQGANPVPSSPVDPIPGTRPAPDRAREEELDQLLRAVEAKGGRVNRGNGHVEMLRDLVVAHGLPKVMQAFEGMTGPIVNAGDVAKYVGDLLRERPSAAAKTDDADDRADRERAARTDRIRRQRVDGYHRTGMWDAAWGPKPDETGVEAWT
jgi:hypothetical protein